tara:strand:+ start:1918 stop:2664 length:747 start_codon:yes stop_codon:yes gene_type:complete
MINHAKLEEARNAAKTCADMLEAGELKTQLSRYWWLFNPTQENNPRSTLVRDVAYSQDNKTFYVNTKLGNLGGQVVVRSNEDNTINLRLVGTYRVSMQTNKLDIPSRGVILSELLQMKAEGFSEGVTELFDEQEFFENLNVLDEVAKSTIGAKVLVYNETGIIGQIGSRNWLEPETTIPLLNPQKVHVKLERMQRNGSRTFDDGPLLATHLGLEIKDLVQIVAEEIPKDESLTDKAFVTEDDLAEIPT